MKKKTYLFIASLLMACFFLSAKADAAVLINTRMLTAQVNDVRVENGKQALKVDQRLVEAAKIRAREAASAWSHTRPDGTDYYTVDPSVVYGENLAFTEDVDEVVDLWMDSPGHADNILYDSFKTTGIGCYVDGNTIYVAQLFGY